jgi:hypothetical protein
MSAVATTYWPHPSEFSVITPRRRTKRAAALPLPASAGPRKPLHLDGRAAPIEVSTVGTALAVTRGARRMQFPLARLSRVLVCGRVRWEGEALALCLRHRVPVVFLDPRAQPIGAAMPLQAQPGALDELLTAFVDRPHWRARYENWLRSQRLRVLLAWRRRRAAGGTPVTRAEWVEAVRAQVYVPEFASGSPAAGASYALVLVVLARAGVRTQYRAFDGGVLPLAVDLGRLLDLNVALTLGTLAPEFDRCGALKARGFEAAAAEHEAFLVELIERLRRRIGEWIEPWP